MTLLKHPMLYSPNVFRPSCLYQGGHFDELTVCAFSKLEKIATTTTTLLYINYGYLVHGNLNYFPFTVRGQIVSACRAAGLQILTPSNVFKETVLQNRPQSENGCQQKRVLEQKSESIPV